MEGRWQSYFLWNFLFTVFYYIKPNQLSQRQHAGWVFLNRVGWLLESKHAVCDYSDEGIEIL